jgi:hypothetical protein
LYLSQQLKGGSYILFGIGPAEWMVQIYQPFCNPRFATAILNISQTFEKSIPNCRIGG